MKKAICVGINYSSNKVKNCINDAYNMKLFLESHGYEVMMITNKPGNKLWPDRETILE